MTFGRLLEGREVDVRGEILLPHGRVGVVGDALIGVRDQRAGEPLRAVEVLRRVAVVHDDRDAVSQPAGDLGDPGLDPEGDLRSLPLRQLHAFSREPGRQGRL